MKLPQRKSCDCFSNFFLIFCRSCEVMVTGLRVPMASSFLCSSPSLPVFNRRCLSKTVCVLNSAKIPMPPINPNDPFLSKLASVAATSPEILVNRPSNSDTPPYLDIFDSPKLMATPAQVHSFNLSYVEILFQFYLLQCLLNFKLRRSYIPKTLANYCENLYFSISLVIKEKAQNEI